MAEVMFRWLVWDAPVCGDHAQQATGTGDQWRRLHGSDAGLAISFEVLRARHEFAQFDVRHDRSIAGSQRGAASTSRGWPHPFPKRRSRLAESPMGQEPKFAPFRIDHLNARETGTHEAYCDVQDLLVQRPGTIAVDQFGADFLELSGGGKLRH